MTFDPNGSTVLYLADHSVWIAVPAFAPAFVVAGVVVYIAAKNRRRDGGLDPEKDGEV
jgi:hypothetical protein